MCFLGMAIGDFLFGAFLFTPSDPGKGVVDNFGVEKNFLLFQKFFQKFQKKFPIIFKKSSKIF